MAVEMDDNRIKGVRRDDFRPPAEGRALDQNEDEPRRLIDHDEPEEKQPTEPCGHVVDQAAEESFPASDPPSWTSGREPDAPEELLDHSEAPATANDDRA